MKAIDMQSNIPYMATSASSDGTIIVGQLMWLSEDGMLNLPDKDGGGFLLEYEWKNSGTCDFVVEAPTNYSVIVVSGREKMVRL